MGDTVNVFRKARGRLLARQIDALSTRLGRPVAILDIGGRERYWDNVPTENIARVSILNLETHEMEPVGRDDIFEQIVGDGRDLGAFTDQSVDMVHSNSVIEHVGLWGDMQAMAREARRVGRAGWIQTPAWEFPIEPHYRLPFVHWLGQPLRRRCLALIEPYRSMTLAERRYYIDLTNMLSRAEFEALFEGSAIHVERYVLPKSYVAFWMPDDTLTS